MAKRRSALGLDKLGQETQQHDATTSQQHDSMMPQQHDATSPQHHGIMASQYHNLIPAKSAPAPSTRTSGGLLRKPIYFDAELWEAIEEIARSKGISASEVCRYAVRHFLGLELEAARKSPGPKRQQ